MGGGQDYEQITVGEDIINNKKELLLKYIEENGAGLYVCGAYQLLGKKYIAADGRQIDGAGVLDIYTEKGNKRFINDVIVESEFFRTKLVGFENHSGRTFIGNYSPLGKVIYGNGNNGEDGNEGLIYKSTIGTYLHGCCLSKNPEISRFLIDSALVRRYGKSIEIAANDNMAFEAKNDIITRYIK
jgi:CobQ-like glutamine amidotransferase family enzyme